MPPVKKLKLLNFLIQSDIVISALEIFFFERKFDEITKISRVNEDDRKKFETKFLSLKANFRQKYKKEYSIVIKESFLDWLYHLDLFRLRLSPSEVYEKYIALLKQADMQPLQFGHNNEWAYKGFVYGVQGYYSEDEIRLLILEDFDRERKYFEKLKAKFDETSTGNDTFDRPRIPESVRVEVWRRDGGKCARCGSREKLEYDHIVPISKGGSNTARNIELLCEKHNRSKSNNVV